MYIILDVAHTQYFILFVLLWMRSDRKLKAVFPRFNNKSPNNKNPPRLTHKTTVDPQKT